MGKTRKRFNWKARTHQKQPVENSTHEQEDAITVDLNIRKEQYDSSNPLILPMGEKKPQKSPEKIISKKEKQLSKKQKRRLAKIVEKKKKTANRSELLAQLQEVQATAEELELMTSTSSMQTSGLKKHPSGGASSKCLSSPLRISNIKGSKKKIVQEVKNKKIKLDPNIVGFEDDSEDDSSSENDVTSDNEKSGEKVEVSVNDLSSSEHARNHELTAESTELNAESTELNAESTELNAEATEILCNTEVNEHKKKDVKIDQKKSDLIEVSKNVEREPAIFVPVIRSAEIQAIRESLPIYSEEQSIMEAIKENPVVVIHGATGSGKTTQVPQFLYEAGYTRNKKLIGITEPRRIAAVQMASRVAEEMNLPDVVSYQIRYEKTATDDKTEIKFMTDGVLMKEIRNDFLLSRYSVIIIDEAHERSVFSDVLIGLLSRILPLREKKGNPLKLVIMSATLRVEDFTENRRLFRQKPFLITLDSRQYDVVLHFNTKTPVDYIQAAYDKVCKIHSQLPSGAVLVFVTGKNEVVRLCKMLKKAFPFNENKTVPENCDPTEETPEFLTKKFKRQRKRKRDESFADLPKIDLDDYSIEPLDNEGVQHQHSDDDEENLEDERLTKIFPVGTFNPLYVLPLYSVLPIEEQAKIFKPPPFGSRLCVVATNVAETSVTIPGLKYVVDTGKVKTRVYDCDNDENKLSSGISKFTVTWTSKASANQRAGRAGRTEGGHCYRLYSSAVFEHEFPAFTSPDIQRIPVDDVLLQLKALGIDRVVNFPFPSPPDIDALKGAERRLVMLGALQDLQKGQRYKDIAKWEYSAKVTPLGKAMSRFPLSPRYAKMLLLSYKHDVIPYLVAIVSAMSVHHVFLSSEVPNRQSNVEGADTNVQSHIIGIRKIGAGKGKALKLGDPMVLLNAVATYEETKDKVSFCRKYHIRKEAMMEIRKMRLQLTREMNRSFCDLELPLDLKLQPPNENQIEKIQKILASSLTDHVAKQISIEQQKTETKNKNGYKCLSSEEVVFIHPSSILAKEVPEYIVYQDISKKTETSKYFMMTVTEIEPEWLTAFAPSQCEFSAPLETPPPFYNSETDKIMCSMTATFGRWNWELPCVVMQMPSSLSKYSYFCHFLLDGQICDFFNGYKKFLLSPPSVMLKQWARLLPRTRSLLQAVIDHNVDCKETLFKTWKSNPKYLLREYCEWLPDDKHMELACNWPPVK